MQHMDPTDFRAFAPVIPVASPLPQLAQQRDSDSDAEAVTDEDDDEDEDEDDDDDEDEEQAGAVTEETESAPEDTGARRRGTGGVA